MVKYKVSILKTANRAPARSVAAAHEGKDAVEEEVARAGTTNRTAPIVGAGTDIDEQTTTAEAAARHGQFERGGKSPNIIILAPT